jgi:hypothetical protein
MTREEFFNRLWDTVKDTDVDFEELLDDDGEGGVFVRFANVVVEYADLEEEDE